MPARLELAGRAEALAAAGTPFVWATVVRAERPTSAKPGDSALVLADGQVDGFVGGDCAEVFHKGRVGSAIRPVGPTHLFLSQSDQGRQNR